jgi:hypothetical protein
MNVSSPVRPADGRWAARCPTDPDRRGRLDAFLDGLGVTQIERFQPKDDDELNGALCEGRYDHVVFADLDGLFEAVWKGQASLERWRDAGVKIEVACPPTPDEAAWRAVVEATYESLFRWRQSERRRQTVAACVLTALALAALAVLFFLVPVPR